jgi:hypothetical protein
MVGMLTHYLHMCESSVGSLFSIVIDSSWPIHKGDYLAIFVTTVISFWLHILFWPSEVLHVFSSGFFMQGWLIESVLYIFLLSLDSLPTAHMYLYSLNRYRRPVLTPSPLRIFHLWNCFKILNLWNCFKILNLWIASKFLICELLDWPFICMAVWFLFLLWFLSYFWCCFQVIVARNIF